MSYFQFNEFENYSGYKVPKFTMPHLVHMAFERVCKVESINPALNKESENLGSYRVVYNPAFTLYRQEKPATLQHEFTVREINTLLLDVSPISEKEIMARMQLRKDQHKTWYTGNDGKKKLREDAENDLCRDRMKTANAFVDIPQPQTGNNKAMKFKENELVGVVYTLPDRKMRPFTGMIKTTKQKAVKKSTRSLGTDTFNLDGGNW